MQANKHEELMLRHWYETRGCNAVVTENSFHAVAAETQALYTNGFELHEVRPVVFTAFAMSCVVSEAAKHRARKETITKEKFMDAFLKALGET